METMDSLLLKAFNRGKNKIIPFCQSAFNSIDKDHDGFISLDELRDWISENSNVEAVSMKELKDAWQDCSSGSGDEIDLERFKQFFLVIYIWVSRETEREFEDDILASERGKDDRLGEVKIEKPQKILGGRRKHL